MTKVTLWATSAIRTIAAAPVPTWAGDARWSTAIATSFTDRPTAATTALAADSLGQATVDDLTIVRRVLDGDREAFRLLVERESVQLVRACLRVLGDQHEAEDVAQEAFVIAYRSLASWRADGPFGAWLARIAVRLAVRQAARRKSVTWVRPAESFGEDATTRWLPAERHLEPEHATLRAERATMTRRAVAALDEPYREVVALRFFAERSLEEIAQVTGRPLGTVKTHLRRGLLRLREGLHEVGGA